MYSKFEEITEWIKLKAKSFLTTQAVRKPEIAHHAPEEILAK